MKVPVGDIRRLFGYEKMPNPNLFAHSLPPWPEDGQDGTAVALQLEVNLTQVISYASANKLGGYNQTELALSCRYDRNLGDTKQMHAHPEADMILNL